MGTLTHWVCFLFFLKRTADVLAPRLSVVFQRLVRPSSFAACWRQANVTPIRKDPPSSVANYRPISITSVLSKMFERLMSVCLGRFMEHSGVLPTTKFAYRKGLGTCDALFVCVALERGQEAGSYRLISAVYPLTGSTIREFCIGKGPPVDPLFCGYWRFCVVYIDTVSIKTISAR